MYKNIKKETKNGAALIIAVLFFLLISIAVVLGAVGPFVRELQSAQNLIKSKTSYYIAEAGSEDVVYRIKNGLNVISPETVILDNDSASVTIINVGNDKEITSDGNSDSNLRRVKTELSTSVTGVSFFYGAQVGDGGLEMDNNSRISGSGGSVGNVYSNGPIKGHAGAVITGDATVATGITEDIQARSLVCNQDQIVGKSDPKIDYAQSFIPSVTGPMAKVSVYLKKVGNPGSREIKIVADNGGVPGDSDIGEGTLNKNLVGTSYSWVDVVFEDIPTLTAGQTYWIVLDAKRDNSKYWVWCSDGNNGFGNGVASYSKDWKDDTWTQITGDLAFKTYSGEGVSSIENVTVDGTARANSIVDSVIGGDAYYKSIANTIVSGTEYPGSTDPAVLNMPISDANIAQFKADATAGGTIVGDCGDSGNPTCVIGNGDTLSIGPKKIDGNLSLSGNQTLNITGTVYITGNVDIDGNGTTVQCDAAFGGNSCTVIIDGWVHIKNNITFRGSGQADSYIMILTTLTGCTGVSGSIGCTDHNGAMDIHNNSEGAIFYASEGQINLHNNVNITSAVAYKLRLDNNSSVTYETGVTNPSFSSGPSGGWSVKTWTETQ